jgi:hypothetical protein
LSAGWGIAGVVEETVSRRGVAEVVGEGFRFQRGKVLLVSELKVDPSNFPLKVGVYVLDVLEGEGIAAE